MALNTGGIAFFQVPTYREGYTFLSIEGVSERRSNLERDGNACVAAGHDT